MSSRGRSGRSAPAPPTVALLAAPLSSAAAPPSALAQGSPAAPPATSRAGGLTVERLAALNNPQAMAWLPNGDLLVTYKPGGLRIWSKGSLSAPIAGVPKVAFRGQGGLFDVEIGPRIAESGAVYISLAEPTERQPGGRDAADTRLGVFQDLEDGEVKGLAAARARLRGDALTALEVIWRAPKTVGRGHFGGRLAFAPDGTLLVTADEHQRFEPAQDRASRIGELIRIETDGSPPGDNPFASGAEGGRDVWSYGHRDPLGIVVAPGAGEVWVDEIGPMGGDEGDLIERVGNYGWPLVSPGDNHDATPLPRQTTRPDLVPAKIGWNPSVSPSGMALNDGGMFLAWKDSLLVDGLSSQALIRAEPSADGVHDVEAIQIGFRMHDVIQAPDGALLLLKDGDNGALVGVPPARGATAGASGSNAGAR